MRWLSEHPLEQMLVCPPTPPPTDNNKNTPMTEAELPPIYVKKEQTKNRIDAGLTDDGCWPVKMMQHAKEESVYAPRSFFDRPSITKTSPEPGYATGQLSSDWCLLHSIENYQSLSLNTTTTAPGHTPNWDLVADCVNNRVRSQQAHKRCRIICETVKIPRKEGKHQ